MRLVKVLQSVSFILNHPLNKKSKFSTLLRILSWQLKSRTSSGSIEVPYAQNSKLLVVRGMTGATGNIYCGLHEFVDMAFMLHVLRKDDLFIDIGANIGSYTVLGASEVGAETIAIEPIPETFSRLNANVELNGIEKKVRLMNIGLGAKNSQISFTSTKDTMNRVSTNPSDSDIVVDVKKMDDIVVLKKDTIIKMDVEGYETAVIRGMPNILNHQHLKAILIELNASSNAYGFDENYIHKTLMDLGFRPYQYAPFERSLTATGNYSNHNTLYIRDFDFIKQRVESAAKVKIRGVQF